MEVGLGTWYPLFYLIGKFISQAADVSRLYIWFTFVFWKVIDKCTVSDWPAKIWILSNENDKNKDLEEKK